MSVRPEWEGLGSMQCAQRMLWGGATKKWWLLAVATWILLLVTEPEEAAAAEPLEPVSNVSTRLTLKTRKRVETSKGSGEYRTVAETRRWEARRTAFVVCDMWSQHWCKGATRRVAEMAPRVNLVVNAARERGALIIHCPSGGMNHYAETAMRRRAQQAPPVKTKVLLKSWCHLDPQRESALPIDDADGGCDCQPRCRGVVLRPQIDAIKIHPEDAITDSAEAYYLMRARGITNVVVMGVHTNMCVLGRPFGIRQLTYQGQQVLLMRDLTDTMYNSRSKPFVNHFRGTDLVVAHIEKYWCPTVTSASILGGHPLRFKNDPDSPGQR